MTVTTLLLFNFFFASAPKEDVPASIYDFKVPALNGTLIDLSAYKGRKILIVNTASKCGFTPQYEALEWLYEKYNGKLVIIGFPANNFFFQEPGSNDKIAMFCKSNYAVTFPMAAKISVKGRHIAAIYQWLTQKKYNGYGDSKVKWNFQKYLINEGGKLIAVFDPKTPPDAPEVIKEIERPLH